MPNIMPNRSNARTVLLEPSPYAEDNHQLIGRDPRRLPPSAFSEVGLPHRLVADAVRAKCLDCVGNLPSEVRKCTATSCPLWAFRMSGSLPPAWKQAALNEKAAP